MWGQVGYICDCKSHKPFIEIYVTQFPDGKKVPTWSSFHFVSAGNYIVQLDFSEYLKDIVK